MLFRFSRSEITWEIQLMKGCQQPNEITPSCKGNTTPKLCTSRLWLSSYQQLIGFYIWTQKSDKKKKKKEDNKSQTLSLLGLF